jgi:hypothetical protein
VLQLPGDKKLNSGADDNSRCRSSCRDKIEFNLQSQKCENQAPKSLD